jgi:cation transport protein ChaC
VTPHLHVFAYGSLIWRPGFPFLAREAALLRGYHRRFCLWSRIYRGTPEAPGLVLGLDRGGACHGVVFHVAAQDAEAVLAYLEERENPRGQNVYHRRLLPVRLASGRMVRAVSYVADRRHPAYCRPGEAEAARTIAQGHGEAGANRDYLLNTVRHLKELGLRDARLDRLAAMLSP